MTIRSVLAMGGLAALMAGCTTSYVVVPATGGRVAAASHAGVSMAAYPETWRGYPRDLPDYLTPIWIDIVNQTSKPVRLRYEDFVLTDQSGFRYAAVSPYSGQPQVSSPRSSSRSEPPPATYTPPAAEEQPAAPAPVPEQPSSAPSGADNAQPEPAPAPGGGLMNENVPGPGTTEDGLPPKILFIRDGRGGGGMRGGGEFHGGGTIRGGGGSRGRGELHGGFRGHGRFHGRFHPGFHGHVFIGPGPFYDPWWPGWWGPYPYYYGPYVYSWDYGYYPGAPSADILRLGLPEGELQPGGRVSGFVYFQNAATRAARLSLTWNAHTRDGQSVASVSVPMVVVEG